MTLTSPPRVRPTSSFSWVPAAAGWTVGIIATLSLIASVSPGIRWLIKEPREFVNDYIFNFPTPASRGPSCWPSSPQRWRPANGSPG